MSNRLGNANVFATLPFDQLDGAAGFFFHDDFDQASLLADLVSGTGVSYDSGHALYFGAEVAGAAVSNITVPVSVADHVGIIKLKAGSTTPADGDAASLQYGGSAVGVQDTVLLDTNGVYVATVVRVDTLTDSVVGFGLIGQTPTVASSSAVDTIEWVYDPENTTTNPNSNVWQAEVNSAGTDVVQASTIPVVASDWVLLEIAADSSSAAFRITTEDATETIVPVVAAMPLVGLRPYWVVENVGTTERTLDIDLFHIRYLRRSRLVGQGSDWLGQ